MKAKLLIFIVIASCTAVACEGDIDDSVLSSRAQKIVFGEPAIEATYDPVGSIIVKKPSLKDDETGKNLHYQRMKCTGTLVAPRVFLTAKHCVVDNALHEKNPKVKNFVGFGPDGYNPDQKIKIKGGIVAPPSDVHDGLMGTGGRDVGIVYLDEAPKGIVPAELGMFKPDMLGMQFEIIGYGYTDGWMAGEKQMGYATARALEGNWYPLLFDNDEEAFHDWYWSDSMFAIPDEDEEDEWWNTDLYQLEPGFELLLGVLQGESGACFGDSGGPMALKNNDGGLVVYGVAFAGEGSNTTVCDLGSAYTILNETMLEFIEKAIDAAPQ